MLLRVRGESRRIPRRGLAAMEVVIILAMTLPMAWFGYLVLEEAIQNFLYIIMTVVGWPLL